ncbi:MAG: nucleotidyltransferase [Actinomycetales bacterium]
MSTTATQHKAWTARGADTAAQDTYASVRYALRDIERRRSVEIFLQGSYANHTNVRADSDVDIVVMTRQAFRGSRERLSTKAAQQYDALPASSFTAQDLRNEITEALSMHYGSNRVEQKDKCIKVRKTAGYVDADVVPCIQYQYYPDPDRVDVFIEGVSLRPLSGGSIINFPKEHKKNGEAKNRLCNERYKQTVRQVKRLRTAAVESGLLAHGVAPGYLLECMTYNIPADRFVYDDSERLKNVVLWLKHATMSGFWSCDEIHRLFTTDPGNFSTNTAKTIVDALWEVY